MLKEKKVNTRQDKRFISAKYDAVDVCSDTWSSTQTEINLELAKVNFAANTIWLFTDPVIGNALRAYSTYRLSKCPDGHTADSHEPQDADEEQKKSESCKNNWGLVAPNVISVGAAVISAIPVLTGAGITISFYKVLDDLARIPANCGTITTYEDTEYQLSSCSTLDMVSYNTRGTCTIVVNNHNIQFTKMGNTVYELYGELATKIKKCSEAIDNLINAYTSTTQASVLNTYFGSGTSDCTKKNAVHQTLSSESKSVLTTRLWTLDYTYNADANSADLFSTRCSDHSISYNSVSSANRETFFISGSEPSCPTNALPICGEILDKITSCT